VALKAFRTCGKPGCPVLIKDGSHCAKHAEQSTQREYSERKADEVRKLYHTKRWEHFTSYAIRKNPQCQRIVDGKRCEQFSKVCHHIVSPRVKLHLMFDLANILCVCFAHHPNTPGEEDLTRYVPTVTE
jgi:5-methylcytosine-specific restriction protein A